MVVSSCRRHRGGGSGSGSRSGSGGGSGDFKCAWARLLDGPMFLRPCASGEPVEAESKVEAPQEEA